MTSFDSNSPYRRLARTLDALPNRFPPAENDLDLKLLAKIFSAEEAGLAADLLPEPEPAAQIAARLGLDPQHTTSLLKEMSKKGLITFGRTAQGRFGFGLLPFVVGIYEAQVGRIDAEMAQLFEVYFQKSFRSALKIQPQYHRVIPVRETVKNDMEVRPYESVSELVESAQSWGVVDCICRTQKALIGEGCDHPRDVCMVLSQKSEAFTGNTVIRALTQQEAYDTLNRAAAAGLVHCVSNNQRDLWYICNCCTCSCSILRGMAELGIANVIARSAFINRVDEMRCAGCGACIEMCQFSALSMGDAGTVHVSDMRCVGCGVCVPVCPEDALALDRRISEPSPPETDAAWGAARKSG